jgi:hypothetical protein
MRGIHWVGLGSLLVSSLGCSDEQPAAPEVPHAVRTAGSAVALSRDERVAVVANRSAGVIAVFALDPSRGHDEMVTRRVEIDLGEGSEPWAAVIGADDDTAYVVLRRPRAVARVNDLHSNPVLDGVSASVGAEPSAIAISPSGKMLFVANWGEGTISMITASDLIHRTKVNLNAKLAPLLDVPERLGLAHPRALAITDDGDEDDSDETLYATEFFSQPLSVEPEADLGHVDRNRQGIVYPVSLATGQPGDAISIAPVQATGFLDGEGRMTSCFPNQLSAAAVNAGRLYVTSMCTSPRGPLGAKDAEGMPTDRNFRTTVHPAVFVIDVATSSELPEQGRLLTEQLSAYYDGGEASADQRMPLSPSDLAFAGDRPTAYVTALGADAVFRLDYDAAGTLQGIGSPGARHIDVGALHALPVGVAVSRRASPPFALAVSDAMQRLSIIDARSEAVHVVRTAEDTPRAVEALSSSANMGRRFFGTGRDFWSFKGQSWSSCESCHPGGLSDGVTWYFARGPRRTLSTASTYDKSHPVEERVQRLLLWGANVDEVHDVEGIVRSVSGGVGGVLWQYANQPSSDCRLLYDGSEPSGGGSVPCGAPRPTTALLNGLNGSLGEVVVQDEACDTDVDVCDRSAATDWNHIDAFIRSLRAPSAPSELNVADVNAGRELFRLARCSGCHGGPSWTLSTRFYEPGAEANGALPYSRPSELPALGTLRETTYSVPEELRALNPPGASGEATHRPLPLGADPSADPLTTIYDPAVQGGDQLQCALRDVGTFPGAAGAALTAEAARAFAAFEVKQDMKTPAFGARGFNIPSLFGLAVGAPYFHAGNARTLEEAFDEVFENHHGALGGPLSADQVRQLVAFLLSIDEATEPEALPDDGIDYDLCKP